MKKIADKIHKLQKELAQLEQCKRDITETLFEGLDEEESSSRKHTGGDQTATFEPSKVLQTNTALGAWTRMLEFKPDIEAEKKAIEMEILRVQSQIAHLQDSKDNLAKMGQQLSELQDSANEAEKVQLVADFKHYLRGKVSARREADYSRTAKAREQMKNTGRGYHDNVYGEWARVDASRPWERGLSHLYSREDAKTLRKESNWLEKNLKSLTKA